MKLLSKTAFIAGLVALSTGSVNAADATGGTDVNALFPALTLATPTLGELAPVVVPSAGLFSQISTSVASPTVAIITPATIQNGGGAQLLTFQGNPVEVIDGSLLHPVYVRAGSLAEPVELTSDGFGGYVDEFGQQWTGPIGLAGFTTVGYYASDVVAAPTASSGPVTLTGVESLTNLSASAYNSLTIGNLTTLPTDPSNTQVASQVALAFGSGSAADITLPVMEIGTGVAGIVISNTALGAVNTISVNLP